MATEALRRGRGRSPRQESEPLNKEEREEIFGNREAQKRINKEWKKIKNSVKVEEEWFELVPAISANKKIYNKVVRFQIKSAINKKGERYIMGKYRHYVGKDYKDPELVKKLKKTGKLRHAKSDQRNYEASQKREKELSKLRG